MSNRFNSCDARSQNRSRIKIQIFICRVVNVSYYKSTCLLIDIISLVASALSVYTLPACICNWIFHLIAFIPRGTVIRMELELLQPLFDASSLRCHSLTLLGFWWCSLISPSPWSVRSPLLIFLPGLIIRLQLLCQICIECWSSSQTHRTGCLGFPASFKTLTSTVVLVAFPNPNLN